MYVMREFCGLFFFQSLCCLEVVEELGLTRLTRIVLTFIALFYYSYILSHQPPPPPPASFFLVLWL